MYHVLVLCTYLLYFEQYAIFCGEGQVFTSFSKMCAIRGGIMCVSCIGNVYLFIILNNMLFFVEGGRYSQVFQKMYAMRGGIMCVSCISTMYLFIIF